jgi:protein SCO1/2
MRETTVRSHARFTASLILLLGILIGGECLSGSGVLAQLPQHWQDDQGRDVSLSDFSGRRVYLTMAYASCRRICPMTMARLRELQHEADASGIAAEFVIVGYDPTVDDPGTWQQYRRTRGLDRENWHFLSGTPASTEQFARRLGFPFWKYERHVMHEFRIVVVDEQGEIAAEYTTATAQSPDASPGSAPLPTKNADKVE